MAAKTLLTLADLERLPEDGRRYELDEGELVRMTFPRCRHQRAIKTLFRLLDSHVEAHDLGVVVWTGTGFVLSREPDTLREPDLSFVRKERMAMLSDDGEIEGAPDLPIEGVSPSESAEQINRKVRQYLATGASTVCALYPRARGACL